MRMIKNELSSVAEAATDGDVRNDDVDDDASFDVSTQDVGAGILDVEESEDSYSVCTNEAVLCYQRALHVLDGMPHYLLIYLSVTPCEWTGSRFKSIPPGILLIPPYAR